MEPTTVPSWAGELTLAVRIGLLLIALWIIYLVADATVPALRRARRRRALRRGGRV